MTKLEQNRPLKVCHTCRHWTYKYKGLCERLGQGVGKFWYCEDWEEGARGNPDSKGGKPGKAA